MAAGLFAQALKLLTLVTIAALTDKVTVRAVVSRKLAPKPQADFNCSCARRRQAKKFVKSVADKTRPGLSGKRSIALEQSWRFDRLRNATYRQVSARRSVRLTTVVDVSHARFELDGKAGVEQVGELRRS